MPIVTALTNFKLIDSMGVNTHPAWSGAGSPYTNSSAFSTALQYLGIYHIRDDWGGTNTQRNSTYSVLSGVTIHGQHIKSSLIWNGDFIIADYINDMVQLQNNYNIVGFCEGANECQSGFTYGSFTGLAGPPHQQIDLWNGVQGNTTLKNAGVKVYAFSVAGFNSANSTATYWGTTINAYCDYANVHWYWNQSTPWNAGGGWDWTSGITDCAGASSYCPGKTTATVFTEVGNTTYAPTHPNGYVDATVQAKFALCAFMDGQKSGTVRTYWYELADDTQGDQGFGLYDINWNQKTSATAVHNFTTIMTTGGMLSSGPGSLSYTLSGLPNVTGITTPSSGNMLYQQADGRFNIVVWTEQVIFTGTAEVVGTTNSATITFGSSQASVKLYDPMVGTVAQQTWTNVSSVTFNVIDHPLIVEVSSGGGAASLNGSSIPTVGSITDSGGNVWTVVGGVVNENGSAAGSSSGVIKLLWLNNTIYQENGSNLWWSWNGTTWVSVSSPLVTSASQTTIPSAADIIDSSGNVWIVSGGVVYQNGVTAGTTSNVIELLYYNGLVYQENNTSNWWDWNGSSWIATSNPISITTVDLGPSSGSWTAPAGVSNVTVSCWGGGGSSSGATFGGAGGGAFAQQTFSVTPGNVYAYTIGVGGTFGGAGGGTSWVSTATLLANGGSGTGTSSGGAGGTTGTTGAIKFAGGSGATNAQGGGGGGAGGPDGAGVSSTSSNGGAGDNGSGGAGGVGADGTANTSKGGGGGGAGHAGGAGGGGAGFNNVGAVGHIVLSYTTPSTISLSAKSIFSVSSRPALGNNSPPPPPPPAYTPPPKGTIVQVQGPGGGFWTCPSGITSLTVQCWGGGGSSSSTVNGGAGGGAFSQSTLTVSPGTTYAFNVGSGGSGGAAGSATWFSSTGTVNAPGGSGTTSTAGGSGGVAGVGTATFVGGNGATNAQGGGGGGSAGPDGNGGNSTSSVGGTSDNGQGPTGGTSGNGGGSNAYVGGGGGGFNGIGGFPGGGSGSGQGGSNGYIILKYSNVNTVYQMLLSSPGSGTWFPWGDGYYFLGLGGVYTISVQCWGGGGGGAGAGAGFSMGGGGGAYASKIYQISSGTAINYQVGSGGGGATGSSNGTNGTASWWGSATTIAAAGGQGNGVGGTAAASFGTVTFSGGSDSGQNHYGGGAGGPDGAGGNASGFSTGGTGDNGLGGAGATGTSANPGGNDNIHGGGGGGDITSGTAGKGGYPGGGGGGTTGGTGGTGGNGQILVTLTFIPLSIITSIKSTIKSTINRRVNLSAMLDFPVTSLKVTPSASSALNVTGRFNLITPTIWKPNLTPSIPLVGKTAPITKSQAVTSGKVSLSAILDFSSTGLKLTVLAATPLALLANGFSQIYLRNNGKYGLPLPSAYLKTITTFNTTVISKALLRARFSSTSTQNLPIVGKASLASRMVSKTSSAVTAAGQAAVSATTNAWSAIKNTIRGKSPLNATTRYATSSIANYSVQLITLIGKSFTRASLNAFQGKKFLTGISNFLGPLSKNRPYLPANISTVITTTSNSPSKFTPKVLLLGKISSNVNIFLDNFGIVRLFGSNFWSQMTSNVPLIPTVSLSGSTITNNIANTTAYFLMMPIIDSVAFSSTAANFIITQATGNLLANITNLVTSLGTAYGTTPLSGSVIATNTSEDGSLLVTSALTASSMITTALNNSLDVLFSAVGNAQFIFTSNNISSYITYISSNTNSILSSTQSPSIQTFLDGVTNILLYAFNDILTGYFLRGKILSSINAQNTVSADASITANSNILTLTNSSPSFTTTLLATINSVSSTNVFNYIVLLLGNIISIFQSNPTVIGNTSLSSTTSTSTSSNQSPIYGNPMFGTIGSISNQVSSNAVAFLFLPSRLMSNAGLLVNTTVNTVLGAFSQFSTRSHQDVKFTTPLQAISSVVTNARSEFSTILHALFLFGSIGSSASTFSNITYNLALIAKTAAISSANTSSNVVSAFLNAVAQTAINITSNIFIPPTQMAANISSFFSSYLGNYTGPLDMGQNQLQSISSGNTAPNFSAFVGATAKSNSNAKIGTIRSAILLMARVFNKIAIRTNLIGKTSLSGHTGPGVMWLLSPSYIHGVGLKAVSRFISKIVIYDDNLPTSVLLKSFSFYKSRARMNILASNLKANIRTNVNYQSKLRTQPPIGKTGLRASGRYISNNNGSLSGISYIVSRVRSVTSSFVRLTNALSLPFTSAQSKLSSKIIPPSFKTHLIAFGYTLTHSINVLRSTRFMVGGRIKSVSSAFVVNPFHIILRSILFSRTASRPSVVGNTLLIVKTKTLLASQAKANRTAYIKAQTSPRVRGRALSSGRTRLFGLVGSAHSVATDIFRRIWAAFNIETGSVKDVFHFVIPVSKQETGITSDHEVSTRVHIATATEIGNASDNIMGRLRSIVSITEIGTAVDSDIGIARFVELLNEHGIANTVQSALKKIYPDIQEFGNTTDIPSSIYKINAQLTESGTATDIVSRSLFEICLESGLARDIVALLLYAFDPLYYVLSQPKIYEITQAYPGPREALAQPWKDPSERINLIFNFTNSLASFENIASISNISVQIFTGTDSNPTSILLGSALILNNKSIQQTIVGGVDQVTYKVKMLINTNLGQVLCLTAVIPVAVQ